MQELQKAIDMFAFLGDDFIKVFVDSAVYMEFPARTELVKEGKFVKYIPIVLEGLVKVYTISDDKELLYYFIKPDQSCIMSFSCIFKDGISRVHAMTEEDTKVALVPSAKILEWIVKYPKINSVFYEQYEFRYTAMMEMVNQAVFHRLDKRLADYLKHRAKVLGTNSVKISHKDIANDLGTAREVISRLLKKLENEGLITQSKGEIEINAKL